jgi:hypothetical protein
LVWSKYLGCGPIKIVFFCPWRLPFPYSLIARKSSHIINTISIAIDFVVLINVTKVGFSCFKDDCLKYLIFREIQIVEVDDGWSTRISSKWRVTAFDAGQKLVLIAEEELSDCTSCSKAVKSYVNADVANILVEVGVDRLLP